MTILLVHDNDVEFKMWYIINISIIYGKLFIHKCKWASQKPSFIHFKIKIASTASRNRE